MTPEGNASVPVMESGTCKGVNMHDRRRAWRLLSSNPDYVEDWQANGGPVQDHFFVVIECQRPVRVCLPRGRRQLHEAQLGTQTRNVPQNGRLNTLPSPPYRTTE